MTNQKNKKNKKTLGLALSGGATFGIAHVGVLKALAENNIEVDCISGTSAGSIAASCYAFGVPLSKMESTIGTMNWPQIAKFSTTRLGFRSNVPLGLFIEKFLGKNEIIENAKIPLSIVATNVVDGLQENLEEGEVASAVRASSAIPVYFTPVEREGKLYIDGAISENIPVSPLVRRGADIIVAVDLMHGLERKVPKSVFDIAARSYEIMAEKRDAHVEDKVHVLIRPDLKAFDSTKFVNNEAILEAGYNATLSKIDEIKKLLHPNKEPKTLLEKIKTALSTKLF